MADRIAQLKRLLESDPEDAFCLYGLAIEYANQRNNDDAIAYFDRALAVDADYCYAYFHKAKALEAAGDAPAAAETLRCGIQRAKAIGDHKALNELTGYLDELA